jgi:hypothetical protein
MRGLFQGEFFVDFNDQAELLRRIYWESYCNKETERSVKVINLTVASHVSETFSVDALTCPSAVSTLIDANNTFTRHVKSLGSSHQERLESVGKQLIFGDRVKLRLRAGLSLRERVHETLLSFLLAWIPSTVKVDIHVSIVRHESDEYDWTVLTHALSKLNLVSLSATVTRLPPGLLLALLMPSLESINLEGTSSRDSPKLDTLLSFPCLQKLIAEQCTLNTVMVILQGVSLPLVKIDLKTIRGSKSETKTLVLPTASVDASTDLSIRYSGPIQAPACAQLKQHCVHVDNHLLEEHSFRLLDISTHRLDQATWEAIQPVSLLNLMSQSQHPVPTQPIHGLKVLSWGFMMSSLSECISSLRDLPRVAATLPALFPDASFILLRFLSTERDTMIRNSFSRLPWILVPNPHKPVTVLDYGDITMVIAECYKNRQSPQHVLREFECPQMLALVLVGDHLALKLPQEVLNAIFVACLQGMSGAVKQAGGLIDKVLRPARGF